MNKFEIFTDSSCDMSGSMTQELSLHVLQLDVIVEDQPAKPNDQVDIKDFYAELRSKKSAKTSAVSMGCFKDEMKKCLEAGSDILYIGFSSALSATYNNGKLAADELATEFPDRKIRTVDSLCASLGQGLLVYYAAKMRDQGDDIDDVTRFCEENKLHICHQFTVDDLFFLKRGGRVNAATAIVGSMLGVKPVLHVDDEGRLINIGKARGRKQSILAMFDKMKETARMDQYKTVFISHGDCIEDAQSLADMIEEHFHPERIEINPVGPVIGAHSGPGTLALFYYGSVR
ncbi:MAG: DegV family protein [Clostridiales bacterium]|nr:DegV family protein [Clostridiales bacterium]